MDKCGCSLTCLVWFEEVRGNIKFDKLLEK